jgi:arylsulfatase A-like enzyme
MHPNYGLASDYTEAELRNLRAHYCAEAELVDRWVGRIFQKLDDLDLWDRTIVFFSTDHGMSLGEHNRTGKSNINKNDDRRWPLYPEIAHIPCLIAAPNVPGGREVGLLTQPADILPTLTELSGLEVAPPDPFHGRSFAAALQGRDQDAIRDYAICGCYLRSDESGEIPTTASTPVLYTDSWAYAPVGPYGARELFDLEADPYGEANVAEVHPDIVADLHAKLVDWLTEIGAPDEAIEPFA